MIKKRIRLFNFLTDSVLFFIVVLMSSFLLRNYIERELKIPALENTTDELLTYIKDFNDSKVIDTPKDVVQKLKELLQEADLVKFAKSTPLAPEIEEDRKDAEDIINSLKIKPVKKETTDEDGLE